MDTKALLVIFLIFDLMWQHVAGEGVPKPDQLSVHILDGEVLVHWKPPLDAPEDSQYNVQMAKYIGEWAELAGCSGITRTYCDLSGYIHEYRMKYKVRVQLVSGDEVSEWTNKYILPNRSELQPPSFTLWATSSTLTVHVHPKPVLNKLFPFGLIYTIYLEERDHNKNITAYLNDEMDEDEDQRTKMFTSLHWGKEYCVSIQVEGKGATCKSSLSPKQCLQLPEQEWFIIAVSSLSILGVLAVIALMVAFLMCYLKRPEKTPLALKSPVSGWLPLSVGEGIIELVTDKGWFLSSYTTEVKNALKVPKTHFAAIEDSEEEEGRESDACVVGIESSSANERRRPVRQEDSGCGSMGGCESSTSSQTEYPSEDERTDAKTGREREDSGVGLGSKLDTMSLDGKECVAGGGSYHSQRPPAVQICDDEEMLQQAQPDSTLAEVVTGYRAGPQSCICAGAGWCTWCHQHSLYGTEGQSRTVCFENELLACQRDLVDFHSGNIRFSDYTRKTQANTVAMGDLDTTFIQLRDTFPPLTCVSTLPPIQFGQDNNTTLSLSDVQLQAD